MSAPHYFLPDWVRPDRRRLTADLCVYGGTAAGIVAAARAARDGLKVVLLHPGRYLGGMTTGGLGCTDVGNPAAIGGMAREVYRRIGAHYGKPEAWRFEPHVAATVLEELIGEAALEPELCCYLAAVATDGKRIRTIRMLGGLKVAASCYVDATYEGDLLAAAGVSYTVSREANDRFGETCNGVQVHDRESYVLAARWLAGTEADVFRKFDLVAPDKTDTNNHGAVSTDFIGGSWRWPEADYGERERIFAAHVRYQQGLHWFMANDPDVPPAIRERYAAWGLAADEFADTGHWPHQLYVREARRIVGDYVLTEADCRGLRRCNDPVGLAAYQMDSHNCTRLVVDGHVVNEGDVQVKLPAPYPISYRSIVPAIGECANLAVPVCVSASHIGFGSVRMEPVFMALAESAAVAARLAMARHTPLQELPYASLRRELERLGQVLRTDLPNAAGGNPS